MINRIVLENWKSHRQSEFFFEKGTNLLIGKMGSGKSSVMNAVSFALFGTFPEHNAKKISLEEIVMKKPVQMKTAKIILEFSANGNDYCVERTIENGASNAKLFKEKKLVAAKTREANEEIKKIIGMDFDLFSRAVYSEQNQADYFLKLPPQQRKEKIDELLEIDRYEKVRANSQTLKNELARQVVSFRESAREMEESFDEKEIGKKEKQIIEKRIETEEEIKKLEKKILEKKETEKELSLLEEKEKTAREKEMEEQKAKTLIERTEKELKEANWNQKAGVGEKRRIEAEIAEKQRELEKLKKEEKELMEKIGLLREKEGEKTQLEKKIRERKSKAKKTAKELLEEKEQIEKEIREIEKILEKKPEKEKNERENQKELGMEEQNRKKSEQRITELEKIATHCHLCKNPLDEKTKRLLLEEEKKFLEKTKEKIREIAEKGRLMESELKKIEQAGKEKENKKTRLMETEEKIKEARETSEMENELTELEKELREQSKTAGKEQLEEKEKKIENTEKEKREMEKIIEIMQKAIELEKNKKELKKIEEQLTEMGFDKKELEKTRNAKNRLMEETVKLESGIDAKKQLIESLLLETQRLIQLREKIEKTRQKTKKLESLEEKLGIFANCLNLTQSMLREKMIEAINQAMHNIWPKLYPYKDLESCKIEIQKGSYEIIVKERNGDWIRAEGLLSGGERAIVGLVTRIAVSLVLARNLSWLILDEPTHNLDKKAIEEMTAMMKENLPKLIDQVFIITHEKELEKASTAKTYLLDREKEENAPTRIELLQ